jgi:lycopene beta-cyclase
MERYDYIIAGAGCAGLSLATRIVSDERLSSKKILIIDKEEKRHNDRTWCFWEKQTGFFEPVVHKSWDTLDFIGPKTTRRLEIMPYRYKMIRSGDFYNHCYAILAPGKQVEYVRGEVSAFRNDEKGAIVEVNGKSYGGRYLFNSTLKGIDFARSSYIVLRQHFRGWLIQTQADSFNPAVATLMDFRTSQEDGTAFFYVLPLSARRALVEYTLFTRDLLESEKYSINLKKYISEHITSDSYEIEEEENGVIPMTNYPFRTHDGNVINIGTAGGHTKASTGYTYQFIQKATSSIVRSLAENEQLRTTTSSFQGRFNWYDSILLSVLNDGHLQGMNVFSEIFRKGSVSSILRFLDNESNLFEELMIMGRLPLRTFAAAARKATW